MADYLDILENQINRMEIEKSRKLQKDLQTAYEEALKKVRERLEAFYAKGYDADNYTAKRLEALQVNIQSQIDDLTRLKLQEIRKNNITIFDESRLYTGYVMENELSQTFNFSRLDVASIERAILNPIPELRLNAILNADRANVIRQVNIAVAQNIAAGIGYRDAARGLKTLFDGDYKKALRVLWTESHRVKEAGRFYATEKIAKKDKRVKKRWNATLDDRTRQAHQSLDGKTIAVDEMFVSPAGGRGLYPGGMHNAADDVNCRCNAITIIEGYEPVSRKAQDGNMVGFITYNEWKSNLTKQG